MSPIPRRRSKPPTSRTPTNRSQSEIRGPTGMKRKPSAPKKNVSCTQNEEDGTQMEARVPKKKRGSSIRKRRGGTVSADKTECDQQALKTALRQFAMATVEKTVNGLVNEFTDLKLTTTAPPAKIAFDANPEKNRYKDVYCSDESRVVLTWPPGSTNDYIHANYVTVRGERRFICTQGPTDKTVDDFWRMIWEQKCRAIVMLCNVMEQGKKKCEQYWPEKLNETMTTASNLTIKNTGHIDSEKILTVTTLEITTAEGGEPIVVKHYLWNAWPDRGVPQNVMACLRLLAQLKPFTPAVVHCSAGIGRTGTIAGLEMAQQTVINGETLSMLNVVKDLRSHRHGSVQTDIQYVYMHRVMLGLAENKKVVSHQELAQFFTDYDAFLKSRGC